MLHHQRLRDGLHGRCGLRELHDGYRNRDRRQAYCLEGLAPGTNGVPNDVCTEPDAHSFIQARAAAWNLRAARACATASRLTLCPHCARGSATRASPSASAAPSRSHPTRPHNALGVILHDTEVILR